MQTLVLAGRSQEPVRVLVVFQQGGAVHQTLGGVPDQIADRFLGIDPEQVLEDAEEGDFLRRVEDLLEDGVEDVQVRVEVDPVRTFDVSLVALFLLVENVELDLKIWNLKYVLTRLQSELSSSVKPRKTPFLMQKKRKLESKYLSHLNT